MTPEEKLKLFTAVAKIETQVEYIHDEMNPQVKKNTRFRLYLTGFILISLPIIGIVMRIL